jgi:predicted transcriptional regulator
MRPPIILFVATATSRALTAEQAMSGQLPFCMPNTSLAQAAKMMAENRVHELPVIVDQRCLGYVSYSDILQRYVKARVEGQAMDIIRTPLPEVRPTAPLDEVVALLRSTGRLLVLVTTAEGMPLGAVTVRDVSRVVSG